MGRVWRNRAFRRQVGAMLLAGALFLPVCFLLDVAAGAVAAALFALVLAITWRSACCRYRQLSDLADRLAAIAGGRPVEIAEYCEGELSVLASEIRKVTAALSHQAAGLARDNVFLADALADISHQLKTPLTAISMMADLLEPPDLPEEQRRRFLGGIRTGTDRIQWLVASLLKLSRLDAGAVAFRTGTARLEEIVQGAAEPLRIAMELRGQVLTVAVEKDMQVETDAHWLGEALGNLLKNAAEHTPQGGGIEVVCEQNALYTRIRVRDSGPGIAARDLPHVFERFYRGENACEDSVGIGLALSRSIVQNLGGTLTAENLPDGGAQFTVKLYGRVVV